MVVGSIWPVDTRDGRSTARWRAPGAARSPVGLPGAIGEEEVHAMLVAQWRSLRVIAI
jgi:hypothetical protein